MASHARLPHRASRLLLAGVITAAACSTQEPAADKPEAVAADVVTEIDALDEVRERFNANVDRPRIITILSAT